MRKRGDYRTVHAIPTLARGAGGKMRIAVQPHANVPAAITWEESACPLCTGARCTPLLEAPDSRTGMRFLIVQCSRCGLCYTNPRPDPISVQQFYPEDYRCHQTKEHSSKADWMCNKLQTQAPGRLLDLGCGAGDFLAQMQTCGWNATGLDASESAVIRARDRGLNVHLGTLPNDRWSGEYFEAITLRQSLEHLHDPLAALRAAYRLLTAQGRILVSVPNFDSVAARRFGADWYGLDVPRHLTHFTPTSLRLALLEAGFDRAELMQQTHASWIRHSAERASQHGDSNWMTRFLRSRFGSGMAGWYGRLLGRADCLLAVAVKH